MRVWLRRSMGPAATARRTATMGRFRGSMMIRATVLLGIVAITAGCLAPVSAASISNAGFETPVQGPGGFTYAPAGASWTFGASAGIYDSQGGPWSTVATPDGTQAAFLQYSGGSLSPANFSQAVTGLIVGHNYTFTFFAARRPLYYSDDFNVLLDSNQLLYVNPGTNSTTSFLPYITNPVTATSATMTLKFQAVASNYVAAGTATTGGDLTSLIDQVQIQDLGPTTSSTPEPSTLGLAASGILAVLMRRRLRG